MDLTGSQNTNQLLTSDGTNPFLPGGNDPFSTSGFGSQFASVGAGAATSIFDRATGDAPDAMGAQSQGVDIAGVSSFFSGLKDFFSGASFSDYVERFGLEILGGIFIIFGFFMLTMRGGDAVANSEAGRAVARVLK